MSRTTWTPHPSGGVSPPGRSVEPKQTRPVGRQTRPPRGVRPSAPTPALPQTRGVPPSAPGLRPRPRDTHTDSDSSAQSRPASALRRLSPGSLVDPALHPSLSLELSGPVNSLPSSHSPGKSRLPWSLSSPRSTRAPPLTGSTQRLRPRALAGAACCRRCSPCLACTHLPVTASGTSFPVFRAEPQTHMLQFVNAQVCREHM